MSTPVVVQGTAVSAPNGGGDDVGYGGPPPADQEQQDPPKTGCNDPLFAILFYVNVIAILVVCSLYGPALFDGTANLSFDYMVAIRAAAVFGVSSLVFSFFGLMLLMQFPSFFIKAGLIFALVVALAYTVLTFINGYIWSGVLGVVFFLLSLCYARAVWHRIPFAAINMVTAGKAVKANFGVVILAMFFALLQTVWLIIWTIALVAVFDQTYNCSGANNTNCDINYGFLFLLLLSMFFTQQVLQSCVHVTVAGTVGTWWVAPSESGCCSRGVCNSFIRTITTSFGSICFGSLLVAIIQALRALASSARSNGDGNFLVCIAECILACIASCIEYFNKWAYIYVGVYGYPYIQAGKSVMQMFADRGWDAIVADDLVGNALALMSVVTGLIIGAIGVGYAEVDMGFKDDFAQNSIWVAFVIGLAAGLTICSIVLSTVASGVNTVIVMFADAPREFEENHPELSQKMREVWNEFHPGIL
jgi:hypothetical protein